MRVKKESISQGKKRLAEYKRKYIMIVKKKAFHKVKNILRNIRKVYYESKRKAFHKVKERVIIYYLTAKPFYKRLYDL